MSVRIDELGNHVEIISGQIMTRIAAKEDDPNFISTRKVVIPKAITSDGFISVDDMPEEKLKAEPPVDRITRVNDIVIKLSTPFDSAIVTKESEGCVVPSFCAIIRNGDTLDLDYLRAFLVSQNCKEQLKAKVSGAVMSILSIGKIKSVEIPVADAKAQRSIGEHYREAQNNLQIMSQIIALENKRNDVMFQELVKGVN
jgi:restriction endonuclease S subunit